MKVPSHVTIDLLDSPRAGDRQVLTRFHLVDKLKVDNAAWRMQMSSAAFIRMVSVKVAEIIIAHGDGEEPAEVEAPKSPEPEPIKNVRHTLSRHAPPGVKR